MAIAWLIAGLPVSWYLVLVSALAALGAWAAQVADHSWETHDSGRIVIDEVVGYLVTVAPVARDRIGPLLVGFAVFRVLDVLKPPPARAVDRKMQSGLGVVLDDVVAGVYGAGLLWLAQRYHFFP